MEPRNKWLEGAWLGIESFGSDAASQGAGLGDASLRELGVGRRCCRDGHNARDSRQRESRLACVAAAGLEDLGTETICWT